MDQFARYVLLFLGLRIELPQIVREEKQLEDKEHNKELDQDNQPERLAQPHLSKTFHVEMEHLLDGGISFHGTRALHSYLIKHKRIVA